MNADECATCETTGRRGYCAPARCYCGHPDCHAVESWVDLKAIRFADAPLPTKRGRSRWDDREGATWIDSL
jgi:hypothetical protein